MLKWINHVFHILVVCVISIYAGYGVYLFWDYKTHPQYYFAQSAPWYTGIQVYGVLIAVILLVLFLIKVIIRKKIK